MPATKSYYDVLGVDSSASADDIKKAFKKLAVKHHPDAGGDQEKFQEISEAYQTLSDPEKRKEYDNLQRYGAFADGYGFGGSGSRSGGGTTYTYTSSGGGFDWADILESIRRGEGAFGTDWDFPGTSRQPRAQRGADLTMQLSVTFDEAFNGATKKVSYRDPESREKKELEVKIPAGAVEGGKLRYKKRGQAGKNGGDPGDLVITTHIKPHPYYKRSGADVLLDVPVSPYEVLLGAEITIPTPAGSKVRLKIPSGTPDGKVFRIGNAGAPDVKKKDGSRGSLLATIQVKMPEKITQEDKKLLEQLLKNDTRDLRAHLS